MVAIGCLVIVASLIAGVFSQAEMCKDSTRYAKNCPAYKSNGFCNLGRRNRYLGFMTDHCRKTCGYCFVKKECSNTRQYDSSCSQWKRNGFCNIALRNSYYTFMKQHCEVTCEYCVTQSKVRPTNCKEKNTPIYDKRCNGWKSQNFCENKSTNKQYKFMMDHCKKTCSPACNGKMVDVKCGVKPSQRGRVVGGKDAKPNDWPWQARFQSSFSGKHHCGGTLIDAEWIVSAAHCFKFSVPGDIEKVVLGDHNRLKFEATEQDFNISKIIIHPNYSSKTLDSDISLVKLSSPVQFNDNVLPACLPEQDEVVQDQRLCTITGWGYLYNGGPSASILQQAEMPIVNTTRCKKQNTNIQRTGPQVNDNMICAGDESADSIKSGCQGDSGGPFVCATDEDVWKLQGAVSWGDGFCNAQTKHTVFVRVSKYINWIKKVMKEN